MGRCTVIRCVWGRLDVLCANTRAARVMDGGTKTIQLGGDGSVRGVFTGGFGEVGDLGLDVFRPNLCDAQRDGEGVP